MPGTYQVIKRYGVLYDRSPDVMNENYPIRNFALVTWIKHVIRLIFSDITSSSNSISASLLDAWTLTLTKNPWTSWWTRTLTRAKVAERSLTLKTWSLCLVGSGRSPPSASSCPCGRPWRRLSGVWTSLMCLWWVWCDQVLGKWVNYTVLSSSLEIFSVSIATRGSRKSSAYRGEGDICELYGFPNSA